MADVMIPDAEKVRSEGSAMIVGVQVSRGGMQVAELLYRGVSFHYPDGTAKLAWSPDGDVSPSCEIRSGNVPGKVIQDIYRHVSRTEPRGETDGFEWRATY